MNKIVFAIKGGKSLGIVTALAVLMGMGVTAQSAVLYQDSFSRTGVLNGSAPDVVNTNGNVWITNTNTGNYSTNGSNASNSTDYYAAAYLAVNGGSGVTLNGLADFTLSATLNPSASDPMISISLTNVFSADGDLDNLNLATLNVGNGFAYARTGNTLPGFSFSTPAAGTPQTVSLAYSASLGTITFNAGGVEFYTLAVSTVQISSLQYVAFGNGAFQNGQTGTFDNFTLNVASVPEPSTYVLMLGGLGILIVLRRKSGSVSR